jgi:hypothetical protein
LAKSIDGVDQAMVLRINIRQSGHKAGIPVERIHNWGLVN